MNATDLYAIVKDHRKWWTEGVTWVGTYFYSDLSSDEIPMEHASLLFEAQFTRHLIGEGFHSFEWASDSDTETLTLICYGEEWTVPHGPGAMLAALCAALTAIEKEKA